MNFKYNTALAVILMLALLMFTNSLIPEFFGRITGMFITSNMDYVQILDLTIEENQTYDWSLSEECLGINCSLSSIKITGFLVANNSGFVRIYIENFDKRYLILDENFELTPITTTTSTTTSTTTTIMNETYSNETNTTETTTNTTEELTNETLSNQTLYVQPEVIDFIEACVETCNITDLLNESSYELIFELSDGATIILDSVKYTWNWFEMETTTTTLETTTTTMTETTSTTLAEETTTTTSSTTSTTILMNETTTSTITTTTSSTTTSIPVELEVEFDRDLECHKCGKQKAPPLTDVKMTVIALTSNPVEDAILTDYYPNEWRVIDENGGIVTEYNSTYNKIEWDVGTVTDSVSRWYVIRSPQRTLPPTKYYFQTELSSQKSDWWMIIVTDVPSSYSTSLSIFDTHENSNRSTQTELKYLIKGVIGDVWAELKYSTVSDLKVAMNISGCYKMSEVKLGLRRYGSSPSGKNAIVRIETDSSGAPSGTLADASLTTSVAFSDIPSSTTWIMFDFNTTVDLNSESTYWIVLTDDTSSDTDYIRWAYTSDKIDGNATTYNVTWTTQGRDMSYIAFGEYTRSLHRSMLFSGNYFPIDDATYNEPIVSLTADESTVYRAVLQIRPVGDEWKWAGDTLGNAWFKNTSVGYAFIKEGDTQTSAKEFIVTTGYVPTNGTYTEDIMIYPSSSSERYGNETPPYSSGAAEYGQVPTSGTGAQTIQPVDGSYDWDDVEDTIPQNYWIYIEYWFKVEDTFSDSDEPEIEFHVVGEGGHPDLQALRWKFGIANPPDYSNIGVNNSAPKPNEWVKHYTKWSDDTGLSGYIFSSNYTGAWDNDTWQSMTGTDDWSNVTKQMPSTPGYYAWRIYANDTSDNWNVIPIQSITVSNKWLEVNWTVGSQVNETCTPGSPCDIFQYNTFNANATVICRTNPSGLSCGNISESIRYNESGTEPNKLINSTADVPFYIVSTGPNVEYDNWNFSVNTQDSTPTGLTFNGTYFWVSGDDSNRIYRYLANGTYDNWNFSVASQDMTPTDITFNGTYFWVVGDSSNRIYRYLANGTYDNWNFSVNSQLTSPQGLTFNGTYFWVSGTANSGVYRYLANGTYDNWNFDASWPFGITFNGIYFWIIDYQTDLVYRYLANGTYDNWNFNTTNTDYLSQGLTFNGTYFWTIGRGYGYVSRYAFYVVNTKSCNPLSDGQQCQLNWVVNATGTPPQTRVIDVNFTSSSAGVNDTEDAYVKITSEEEGPQLCDVNITWSSNTTYTISQSNTYYCLNQSWYLEGITAISFAYGVQNSTLDCLNYNLSSNHTLYGIYLFANKNNTIKNCNITDFYNGILFSVTNNNTIKNNIFYSNNHSIYLTISYNNIISDNTLIQSHSEQIYLFDSDNNTIENNVFSDTPDNDAIFFSGDISATPDENIIRNNTITNVMHGFCFARGRLNKFYNNTVTYTKSLDNARGFNLVGTSNSNILEDNIVFNSSSYGIYVSTENNTIKYGSIHGSSTADYYFASGAGTSNYFTNTNFTDSRKIQFEDTTSWFNYNNETNGNIWLKTSISSAATITRKLISWSKSIMRWNDSVTSARTARYNISGLLDNRQYKIYNDTQLVDTLTTDSSGSLSFTIYLASEHLITVQHDGCEVGISTLPYNLTQSNKYYCIESDLYIAGQNAIMFVDSIQNSTLDCLGYNIDSNDDSAPYGVSLTGSNTKNNTIKNCNITDFYEAIYLYNGPNNSIINNNVSSNTGSGIRLHSNSNNNILTNNIADSNMYGIYISTCHNNILINNTISGNTYGMLLYTVSGGSTSSNSIKGGSIYPNTYDYYLNDAGSTNNFTDTYFTGPRKIQFEDTTSWFNYNNETNGNIWLKTKVSSEATTTITRKLINWNQNLMKWNDSTVSSITATYNITGLKQNTVYYIYNNSQFVQTLQTDPSGNLPSFTIYLGSEHEIKVQEDTFSPQIQFVPPTDDDNAYVNRNYSYVNVSITDASNTSSFIDWNRSLVGYWSMDWYNSSGVYDNSTYNNFGRFNGGLNTSNITTGKFGYGLEFDGINDYVNVGNPIALNITGDITVIAWIKITGNTGSEQNIVGKRLETDNNGYWLTIASNNYFWLDLNGTDYDSSTSLTNNIWYQISAVANGTHVILYKNDVIDSTLLQTSNATPTTGTLRIGQEGEYPDTFFNGTIDEVRIYNRALSPEEINASYNSGLYRLYHNFTNLADGQYEYYAYAIDTAGNWNKTGTRILTVDTQAPKYWDNSTNNTEAGQPTLFSLRWTDNIGLAGYIFSFDNGTGTFENDTWKDDWNFTPPNAIFADGFESGDFTAWTAPSTSSATIAVNSSVAHRGTYSANASGLQSAGEYAYVYKNLPSTYSTFYLRYYVRFASLFNAGGVLLGSVLHSNSNIAFIIVNPSTSKWGIYNVITDTPYYESGTSTIAANTWYCVEMRTTISSTAGILQLWVDGELKVNQTGLNTSTSDINQMQVGTYLPAAEAAERIIYNDDVVASTSYIGTETTAWSNVTKTLNTTPNTLMQWRVYANDTSNNWNASEIFSLTTTDETPPKYFDNTTNNTIAGKPTLFSSRWTDNFRLDGYIFSFDNCTGSFVNDTWNSSFKSGIFSDDVESGTTANWDGTLLSNGTVVPTTDTAYEGRYSLKANVTSDGDAYAMIYKNLTSRSIAYGRVYANFTLPSSGYVNKILEFYNLPSWVALVQAGTNNTAWSLRYRNNSAYYIKNASSPIPQNNTWYSIELKLNASSADGQYDGEARLYVDGVEILNATGIDTDYTSFNSFYTGRGYFLYDMGSGVTYIDCAKVDGSYIGTDCQKEGWSNVTKVINSTVGCTVRWRIYANDTYGNWNASDVFSFTTLPTYCDYSIQEWELPYTISQSNKYYCLASNEYIAGQNAINFTSGVQNSTLDCLGYNLNSNDTSGTNGVYLTGSSTKNNTIKNCNITHFYRGIRLESNSNIITNNTVNDNKDDGVLISASNNNIITNNTVNNNYRGISVYANSNNNTITNNIVTNNNNNWGIRISSSSNTSVTGGSVASNTNYDYYLDSAGTTNNFTNTNFTASRTIYFYDTTSWFNYNNETNGNIWLKTNVSAATTITRELINWDQSLMEWNDTNSSGSDITARYNITGLKTNTYYSVYNNSQFVQYLQTDSSGNLPSFTIYLSSEHEIKVEEDIFSPQIQFVPPTDDDNAYVNRDYSYVNVSITDASNTSSFIDWNRSLVGYWSMDWYNSTGVYDNSTYNNFGTFHGSLGTSRIIDAKYGKGLEFDGNSDYVTMTNSESLNTSGEMTAEAWVYPKQYTGQGDGQYFIVEKGYYPNYGWIFELYEGGYVKVIVMDQGAVGITTPNTIPLNTWSHVAFTHKKNVTSIYINGNLSRNQTSKNLVPAAVNLRISNTDNSYDFNGTIDEVKIWNRALSPEEINASYNSGLYRLYHNFTNLADGQYQYYAYAIDTAGNANKTETRTLTVDTIKPLIEFVPPTDDDNAYVNRDYSYVNVSITDASNTSSFIDWNRSLVGYWSMDWYNSTGVYDNSTYNNFGTFHGSLGTSRIIDAKYGKGLEFDGNDHVDCGNDSSLMPTNTVTVGAWIYINSYVNWDRIVQKSNPVSYVLELGSGTNMAFNVRNSTSYETVYSTGINITTGKWYHVVGTYNSSILRIYVNGQQRGSEPFTGSINTTTGNLNIGRDPGDFNYFNGIIDEVRIYNRALSREEIRASYNSGLYRLYHNFTSLTDGQYQYYAYAIDTAGNANKTGTRYLNVDTSKPQIDFVNPTDSNNAYVNRNYSYVNVSITDASNTSSFIDWNRSLVGYWSFEHILSNGTVYDNSTYENTGTMINFTSNTTVSGKYGKALELDGVNDYIQVPDSSSLDIPGSLTLETWIKWNGSTHTYWPIQGIIAKRENCADSGNYGLYIQNGTNKVLFEFNNGTGGWVGWKQFLSNTNVTPNIWTHIVVVLNTQSKTVKIYFNGTQDYSTYTTQVPVTNDYNIMIGMNGGCLEQYFNGTIDEVKIWNRALSPEEINASYNSGLYRLYHNFTSLTDGQYQYYAYAIDTAGNANKTGTRYLTIDTQAPRYWDNSTNNTEAGKPTKFSLRWTDNVGLNNTGGYIFSTNNTGTWVNDSFHYFGEINEDSTDWENQLVGLWHLNEGGGTTAYDSSSYGNDGILYNGTTQICGGNSTYNTTCPRWNSTTAMFDSAVTFDGIDDMIDIGYVTSANNMVNFTISAWINPADGYGITNPRILDKAGTYMYISASNGWAHCHGSNSTTSDVFYYDSTYTIPTNKWTLITCVYGGNTISMYINGTFLGSNTQTGRGTLNSRADAIHIGDTGTGIDRRNFNGTIDEVAIWNRSLTATEISTLYNMALGFPTQGWSNVTKILNSTIGTNVQWRVYANDTANNWNASEIFSLTTTDDTPPQIEFVPPTDDDNAYVNRDYSYVNVSITDASQTSSFIDWNRSLVGYWAMDWYNSTGVFDNSSYNNFGTFSGVGTDNITSGKFGDALQFDGYEDYIQVNDSQSLGNMSQLTVEAWIKLDMLPSERGDSNNIILHKDHGGTPWSSFSLYIYNTSEENNIVAFSVTNESEETAYPGTSDTLAKNVWYHIVGVYNGTDVLIYLNGSQNGWTNSLTGNVFDSNDSLYISYSYYKQTINGTMDEVRIWNRALSPEEINASYNSGLYRLYRNFTNLADGQYQYYAYAIDTAGNANKTETRTLTVDTTPPQWSDNKTSPSSGTTYSLGKSYQFNVTCNDNIGIYNAWLTFDGNNYPMSNESSEYYNTITDLSAGSYSYKFTCNDTSGNTNTTDTWTYVINKAKPVLIMSNNTATVNTSGLVGYWRFDEGLGNTTYDSSGWNNTGSCNGSSCPSWTTGRFGKALKFDGSDDWINVTRSDSLKQNNSFSAELWIYPRKFGNYNQILDCRNSDAGSGGGWGLYHQGFGENKFAFNVQNGTHNNIVSAYSYSQTDKWYHIVGVFNGSSVSIYIDGELINTTAFYGTPSFSDNPLHIGNKFDNTIPVNGTIDEVRIWNRSLSASEIKELYESKVSYGTQTNFSLSEQNQGDTDVYYDFFRNGTVAGIWHFDESSGSQYAFDYSDNNNTGILTNMNITGNPTSGWSSTDCKYGSCLKFDGIDDYVNISDDSSLEPMNTITIEAWVKFNSLGNMYIVGKDDLGSNRQYYIRYQSTNNYSTRVFTSEGDSELMGEILETGRWYHVAMTWNGSTHKQYLNGTLLQSENIGGTLNQSNIPLIIGCSSTGEALNGTIDEVKIYPRALSEKEILCRYANNCSEEGFNNETTTLPMGYHYYVSRASGGQNYTTSALLLPLNVTKTIASCSLTSSSGWTYTYGISTILTCSCLGDGTTHLYLDGVQHDDYNDTSIEFAANPSGYSVVCNITEGFTYGSASNSSTLTINKAPTSMNLLLNGTDGNRVYHSNESVNITADLNMSFDVEIWTDFTGTYAKWDSGPEPLMNYTVMNYGLGPFNVTGNFSGNQNYSASYDSHLLTVWGWSNLSWVSPDDGDYVIGDIITLNCSVLDANISNPISNYPVNFYNKTDTDFSLIGTNLTDLSGYAIYYWNTSNVGQGTHYPTCNITDNSTLYYNASVAQANTTITLSPNQPPNIWNLVVRDMNDNPIPQSGTVTGVSINITVNTSDPDNNLAYVEGNFTWPNGTMVYENLTLVDGKNYTHYWTYNIPFEMPNGTALIKVTAYDTFGASNNTNTTLVILETIEIVLLNQPINFTSVYPGQEINATTYQGWPLNISTLGNVPINITQKGEHLTGKVNPLTEINVQNITWNQTDLGVFSSLTTDYITINGSKQHGEQQYIYYKLNVPIIEPQPYGGNVYIKGEQT